MVAAAAGVAYVTRDVKAPPSSGIVRGAAMTDEELTAMRRHHVRTFVDDLYHEGVVIVELAGHTCREHPPDAAPWAGGDERQGVDEHPTGRRLSRVTDATFDDTDDVVAGDHA